jgi:predicted RNA-binding Zn-ribbon protein involved in translation (DUF1610 family)
MSGSVLKSPYTWTFQTATDGLKACPICGEVKIERVDAYRTSPPPGMVEYESIVLFKCGHRFTGKARDSVVNDN